MQSNVMNSDTICAIATPHGMGAIAVVRISGADSHRIVEKIFSRNGKPFDMSLMTPNKAYFGNIIDGDEVLDEVLVTFFKAPHSFTGEDSAEISIHGSEYIQRRLLEILIAEGARMAQPGEYSRRAFVNRKFDLAQAEAIADLIASENEASHRVAMNQLKGGFSKELQMLRDKLLEITSLMELELDFSEEDVTFADRKQLNDILDETMKHIKALTESFRIGNAIRNGIPVAIVGETNSGKSTLLNALLGEDRAIVSDIAGTTRDTIEEILNVNGIPFRFIDTAGIRDTEETIEKIGIERTFRKIAEADIIIGMIDITKPYHDIVEAATLFTDKADLTRQRLVIVLNKTDISGNGSHTDENLIKDLKPCIEENIERHGGNPDNKEIHHDVLTIRMMSAKNNAEVESLRNVIGQMNPAVSHNAMLVTNIRHYEALRHASESLEQVQAGLANGVTTDLIAQDLREALYHLGSITGEITTDEVLKTIFGRFCIGK